MPPPPRPNWLLALIYLLLALPLTLRIASLTPPLQTADEAEHVMRAAQVGEGGLVARRAPDGQVGGVLPLSLGRLRESFYALRFRATAPGSTALRRAAASLDWQAPRGILSFANTAVYPPVFYLPQAAALDIARALRLRLLPSLSLVRDADAVLATLLAALSILVAEAAPALLAALLALPMTLSLFASCSQDAILVATAGLLAAWLGRRAASRQALLVAGLVLGCLGAARPPYLALSVLPLLVGGTRSRAAAGLAAILATSVALLWIGLGAAPCLTPTRAGGSLLGGAQMDFLLHHPRAPLPVAWHTLQLKGPTLVRQTIGVLGWLDVTLPGRTYVMIGALLLALGLLGLPGTPPPRRWAIGLALLVSDALIFGLQYLSWTPRGAPLVEGVQGRYFIPSLLLSTLLLPSTGSGWRRRIAAALLTLLLLLDWNAIPRALISHYVLAARPS